MSSAPRVELTRGKIALLVLGVLGIAAVTAGVTVLVEHAVHGEPAHGGHSEDEHGHEHGKDEHGKDEHGKDEHGHGKDEHGHGEEEHGEGRVVLKPAMVANAGVEVVAAGPGRVAVTVTLPGEVALNADRVAHVTPRVAGVVREVKRNLGDVVKKGEVLAVLDSRELADLQREALTARERLELAETSFKRQEALWQEKVTSEKEFLAAKQALAEARIEHRSALQKLSVGSGGRSKDGGYALMAPLDGAIIERHATVGEVLTGDTRAFTVADLSTIWVNVTVYAKDLAQVRVGQVARVRAEGIAEAAEGTITYLSQVADEQTRSSTARVVLLNPGPAWRPGLFATADIGVNEIEARVTVLDEAVQRLDGKDVVFVQEGDAPEGGAVFEARPVRIGRRGTSADGTGGKTVEVLAGIEAGDRYAGKNSFVLKAELGKSGAAHEH
ncbi:efflux RND transporter periplasmic adaptor subunit [Chondromyces apiculatus]|uniref:Cobalt/zinc/cadmium efflux RND transporter, membrane fusion protein, CzcB family n=1 Tax=Chondromyces apiculatus DSM 436 TaxID=1192034 RepID=A0A017TF56_9BACT|nr:efflux RND transporter periplasmic adaptor subunit [Chondromyces apiculatus]EYF07450.1 Cobalt/zinc/cadmium efflux RND transporter, membrane fusion protein, CzcB family [Chondromyces apiculatus DSM 436]